MKYRWVFSEGGLDIECHPIVDDDAAIDFQQQTNEVFYRAKLNGSLAFRFEFDDIIAKGYNHEHIIVLQWYDEADTTWKEVWRGRFALTDCEIDFDTKTITVQPETQDRYTNVLDHLEDEYNLLKLAPVQQPVNILIRPLLQVYALNDSSISNCIGNNTWVASCDSVGIADIANYHFSLNIERIAFVVHFNSGWTHGEQTVVLFGEPNYDYDHVIDGIHRAFYVTGKYYNTFYDEYRDMQVLAGLTQYPDESTFGLCLQVDGQTGTTMTFTFEKDNAGTSPAVYISPSITSVADANAQWDKIYSRVLLQTELGEWPLPSDTLYDLANDDMAGANLNYNKVSSALIANVVTSSTTQEEPTEWGMSYDDQYFTKPSSIFHLSPVGQSLWKYISYWYYLTAPQSTLDNVAAQRTIKDAYKVPSILLRLFQKSGMSPIAGLISRVLNGNNDYVGDAFFLCMTPKSNVISSYYDTPAQNAPITLQKMLSMLKQAYKIYWHIDENGYIHFEHISYYDNGQSYTETTPTLLVDLESQLHTNTKNNKVFGQNKVKFDKADMPELYTFGWADAQTKVFDGWQIKGLDAYVSKGQSEEKLIGDFDTDVDFVLSSPNDVSKEGFFLFACPCSGGVIHWGMDVQKFIVTDENGEQYDVSIQNADGAFYKIHNSYWRYQLPCENVNINNKNTTAITTGRFKVQSVEFADVVMAEILKNVDECMKVIRTQQGDGHIKNLSINLNSLKAKGDLVFNFIGRWYYLRGTALGASITITINGEQVEIEVDSNSFIYRYSEPITSLTFDAADVVSVDFADTDRLENLTSADNMFNGCAELVAVDFDSKDFAAVVSANNMFKDCAALTTLICPDNSTWKPDLDFTDCPLLTADSLYDLIGFLYLYNTGTHTITPNTTMWQALDSAVQDDIIAKAQAKGWNIAMPAQYSITGYSGASTVYVTINGLAVEIEVTGGAWHYDYNTPITSISFENDADITSVDFSLSDGLAGLTSLNDAFKNCSSLTTVIFTNCDLSNVASASDCFANCTSLSTLTIPSNTWKPDVDLSATAIAYAEMSNVVSGLYTYTSGTHTITFNSTIWDALSVAQQQTIFDAAQLKWWTTNAVAVVYYVRGTSSAASETFNIQYINNGSLTPNAAETISVVVDGNGNWEFSYYGKKIYSLYHFANQNSTCLTIDFSSADDLLACVSTYEAFMQCTALTSLDFSGKTLENVTTMYRMFSESPSIVDFGIEDCTFANVANACAAFSLSVNQTQATSTIDLSSATFASVLDADSMFRRQNAKAIMPNATFASVTNCESMFRDSLADVVAHSATFASATNINYMFSDYKGSTIDLPNAIFGNAITAIQFINNSTLTSLDLSNATFASATNIYLLFGDCLDILVISLPKATFANVTNALYIFSTNINYANNDKTTTIEMPMATFEKLADTTNFCRNKRKVTKLDISATTFESVTKTGNAFQYMNLLVDLSVPQNSTAIVKTSTAANAPLNLSSSPLNYASMLKVANWLVSLVGYTAHTCTFKASAWNALSSAEQSNIDGILSGKNWTRAIA